ncbi:MAG: acyl-CoA dehydrogenase, partial [Alphaproteobacteria bacterium]|nr:acyl-CoA dehydrogenase [Alphaproteobacteria bacterium]
MGEWIGCAKDAAAAAGAFRDAARARIAAKVAPGGKVDAALVTREQHAVHGFAWIAATTAALDATADWAVRADAAGNFGRIEELALRIGFGEYAAQLVSGVPMSAGEIVRPHALGVAREAGALAQDPAIARFLDHGNTVDTRAEFAALLAEGARPDDGLGDETLDLVREQFRAFTADRIAPRAHGWHLADALIPAEVIAEMAELGVFGVCIDERYGGLGLGKLAMS